MFPKKINGALYCYRSFRNGDSFTSKSYGRCKANPRNVKCKYCKHLEKAKRMIESKDRYQWIRNKPWHAVETEPKESQNTAKLP